MIFVSNDEANQEVTVLDANWGAYNIIKMHAISYDQLLQIISWGNTMALFRFTPCRHRAECGNRNDQSRSAGRHGFRSS
jgi:hypothetical protein